MSSGHPVELDASCIGRVVQEQMSIPEKQGGWIDPNDSHKGFNYQIQSPTESSSLEHSRHFRKNEF